MLVAKRTTILTDGYYCFTATSGLWKIWAEITPDEEERGLLWEYGAPGGMRAYIIGQGINNINIVQANVTLSGTITCFEPNKCLNRTITITEQRQDNEKKMVLTTTTDSRGMFLIREMPANKFTVQVDTGHYCWRKEKHRITVEDKNHAGNDFYQTGYKITYDAGEKFNMMLKKVGDAAEEKKRIQDGKKRYLCMESPGDWQLRSTDECTKLEEDIFKFDTSGPVHLNLMPRAYKLQGTVNFSNDSDEKIGFKISGTADESITWDFEDTRDKDFTIWVPVDAIDDVNEITIEPYSLEEGSLTIFEPKSKKVVVERGCNTGVNFKANEGMLIEGGSTPPISGAEVIITSKDGLDKLEPVQTDTNGKFVIGPIVKASYEIQIEKQDYIFTKKDGRDFDFIAKKIAKLDVIAKDSNGKLLDGVFVSISASKDIKKATTDETGKVKFSNVLPQKYYVTSILKEYTFGQPTAVQIEEEEHQSIELVGTRV